MESPTIEINDGIVLYVVPKNPYLTLVVENVRVIGFDSSSTISTILRLVAQLKGELKTGRGLTVKRGAVLVTVTVKVFSS
jgi:hypothetical protein